MRSEMKACSSKACQRLAQIFEPQEHGISYAFYQHLAYVERVFFYRKTSHFSFTIAPRCRRLRDALRSIFVDLSEKEICAHAPLWVEFDHAIGMSLVLGHRFMLSAVPLYMHVLLSSCHAKGRTSRLAGIL